MSGILDNIQIINAGAGSGKTYQITQEIFTAIAEDGLHPDQIIATTFTRKAAAELSGRIRSRLAEEGQFAAARSMSAALIGTVNSVCGHLLQRYCYEAGITPEVTMLGENESPLVLAEAVSEAAEAQEIEELDRLSFSFGYNDAGWKGGAQHNWHDDVRKLIELARSNALAAEDIVHHAELSVEEITALLPHTENSWSELRTAIGDEIERALGLIGSEDTTKDTKNAKRLLTQLLRDVQSGNEVKWSDLERLTDLKTGAKSRDAVEALGTLASDFYGCREYRRDISRYINTVSTLAVRTMDILAHKKRWMGVMDFVDQEAELLHALENPAVISRLKEDFRLLVVDEFQDTSPIQLAIFMKLAAAGLKTIWVGDPKQSIYGFREADPALMQAVLDVLPESSRREPLGSSRRSRPDLVHFSNAVFTRAFAGTMPGVSVALQPVRSDIFPGQPGVRFWLYPHEKGKTKDEYFYTALVAGIQEVLSGKLPVQERSGGGAEGEEIRPVRGGDIAVLCRTGSHAEAISGALNTAGIPAVMEQPGLLSTPGGVLVMAAFRFLSDHRDSLCLAEILMLTSEDTDPAIVVSERIQAVREGRGREWAHNNQLVNILEELRDELQQFSLLSMFDVLVARANLPRLLGRFGDLERVYAHLQQFRSLIAEYSEIAARQGLAASPAGVAVYLQELAEQNEDRQAVSRSDTAVYISTYHGAKGLEWPVVIATDLDSNKDAEPFKTEMRKHESTLDAEDPLSGRSIRFWPRLSAKKYGFWSQAIADTAIYDQRSQDQMAEENRVLYVGLTRARDYLILPVRQDSKGKPKLKWFQAAYEANGDSFELPDEAGVHGEMMEWTGKPIPVRVSLRSLADEPDVQPAPNSVSLPTENRGRVEYPPYRLQASTQAEEIQEMEPVSEWVYGSSLSIVAPGKAASLGEAVHALYALTVGRGNKVPLEEVQQVLLQYGAADRVDADSLSRQAEDFLRWISLQWPHSEVEVETSGNRASGGRVITARLDLLIRTDDEMIIIDHKTLPGLSDLHQTAAQYSGQLSRYKEVVSEAVPERQIRTMLNLVVQGKIVELQ